MNHCQPRSGDGGVAGVIAGFDVLGQLVHFEDGATAPSGSISI
jgi:hypothetical protein